jgi:hypothetical protein
MHGDGTTVPADFAADLERELNAANAEVERLRAELARRTTEPVAWQWLDTANFRKSIPEGSNAWEWNPLYAHLPAPLPALKETK